MTHYQQIPTVTTTEVKADSAAFSLAVGLPSGATEDSEGRLCREEEESLELARALMAEEAMASYEHHFMLLQQNVDQMSPEDLQVWRAALQEEERDEAANLEGDDGEISYDAMLQLGERIGDVKTERWTITAQNEINKLPTFLIDLTLLNKKVHKDASECKCLICQCEYEEEDQCRRLPCSHGFHKECIDQWLMTKDCCPYCRQCIVKES